MKKLILKIIVLMVIFLVLDRIVGAVIALSAMNNANDKRIGMVLSRELRAELLILGSSRAARNFVASEVGRAAGLAGYNLGVPGTSIDFHTEILRLLLEAGNSPRYVVLAVDNVELKPDKTINFRYDVLSPYILDERVFKIFQSRDRLSPKLSSMFATYKQKDNLWTAIPLGQSLDMLDRIEMDGSMPLSSKSITYNSMAKKTEEKYSTANESPALIERFKEFTSLCRQHHIRLFIVVSPNYGDPVPGLAARLAQVSGDGVVFLDYGRLFREKENYYDFSHLNKKGAMKLSALVGNDIRASISKSEGRGGRVAAAQAGVSSSAIRVE